MSLALRWLGTACFESILPNRQTLILDPYVDDSVSTPISSDQFTCCHYIFITHGHYDHVLDAGKLAARFGAKIFCNEVTAHSLTQYQGVDPALITPVKAGDVIQQEGLIAEVVRGVHVDFAVEYRRLTGKKLSVGIPDGISAIANARKEIFGTDWLPEQISDWMAKYPPGEHLNFILAPRGGKRIYMAGSYPDPSLFEVAEKAKAYITLLQVMGGRILCGLEEQTASFAVASGCRVVVPQHHDPLFRGAKKTDLTLLKKIVGEKSNILFQEFVPGQWYEFE